MFCPQCGRNNERADRFCGGCGHALDGAEAPADAAEADRVFYETAIGPKRRDYYLERFARFDEEGGSRASWHWPAFFFTQWWLLYRKMWLYAALYFVLPSLLMMPMAIALGALSGDEWSWPGWMFGVWFILYFVLPGLFANALYHRHCRRLIARVRASSDNVQRQLGELSARGGTSRAVFVLLLLFGLPLLFGMVAAIALPVYQAQALRAELKTGVDFSRRAAQSVGEFYERNRHLPDSVAQAGFKEPFPRSVKRIQVDGGTGIVTVTLGGAAPIDGRTLVLTPSRGADGRLSWSCASAIGRNMLPPECR